MPQPLDAYRPHIESLPGSIAAYRVASGEPQVLIPFHRLEVITIAEAAVLAKRTRRTLRGWCIVQNLGRRIGGQWAVSRVALTMFLESDGDALRAYLRGDRQSDFVVAYFERCGVPLLRRVAT